MTSTPVTSDVGSILFNMTTQPAQNEKAGENFSDVLSKQTQSEADNTPKRAETGKAVKVENARTDKVKEPAVEETEVSETVVEDETQVTEAAEELAKQMLQSVAEELGISVEELEKVMEELGLTMLDLLQSDNLMQVFVVAGGAQDAISLITNEDMYASFMKLNEQLTEGLKEIADLTGMEVSQIQDYLSQISGTEEEAVVMETMPEEMDLQSDEQTDFGKLTTDNTLTTQTEEAAVVKSMTGEQTQTEDGGEETKDQGSMDKGNQFMMTGQLQQQVEVISNGVRYTESVYSAETQMIMDQIMEFMKIQVGEGITRLEMQLQPESLGTVQVQIASKDGVITAQFTAQNEMVKNALESQMIQLKETFDAQGIKVDSIEVAVQSQAFDRNLHQGRGQQGNNSQESKTSGRVRRLNLNALEEGIDEILDEADQLAAQMMEQNGNTVDYTV